MPIIKGTERAFTSLDPLKRDELTAAIRRELHGENTLGGPVIFEIPLDDSGRMDVIVVWNEFESLRSHDREWLIMNAYGPDQGAQIAQVIGVTVAEAIEQDLLPYSVYPVGAASATSNTIIADAMREMGAMTLPDGNLELRLPTLAIARQVRVRLEEKRVPNIAWALDQN